MIPRRKRNSSRVNLIISVVFHSALIFAVFYFAAREGMLGKKLKQLTVTMVPKEKKPEPPKEKPAEPKVEQPKSVEAPKIAAPPKVETAAAPPPAVDAGPAVAPAPATLPAFEFDDGAKEVRTVSDPNGIYAALVEHALKSHWNRPEDIPDENFAVEVELAVASNGKVNETRWLKTSGNARWDNSVKAALAATPAINRPPPKGFPEKFRVRFDVENLQGDSALFGVR